MSYFTSSSSPPTSPPFSSLLPSGPVAWSYPSNGSNSQLQSASNSPGPSTTPNSASGSGNANGARKLKKRPHSNLPGSGSGSGSGFLRVENTNNDIENARMRLSGGLGLDEIRGIVANVGLETGGVQQQPLPQQGSNSNSSLGMNPSGFSAAGDGRNDSLVTTTTSGSAVGNERMRNQSAGSRPRTGTGTGSTGVGGGTSGIPGPSGGIGYQPTTFASTSSLSIPLATDGPPTLPSPSPASRNKRLKRSPAVPSGSGSGTLRPSPKITPGRPAPDPNDTKAYPDLSTSPYPSSLVYHQGALTLTGPDNFGKGRWAAEDETGTTLVSVAPKKGKEKGKGKAKDTKQKKSKQKSKGKQTERSLPQNDITLGEGSNSGPRTQNTRRDSSDLDTPPSRAPERPIYRRAGSSSLRVEATAIDSRSQEEGGALAPSPRLRDHSVAVPETIPLASNGDARLQSRVALERSASEVRVEAELELEQERMRVGEEARRELDAQMQAVNRRRIDIWDGIDDAILAHESISPEETLPAFQHRGSPPPAPYQESPPEGSQVSQMVSTEHPSVSTTPVPSSPPPQFTSRPTSPRGSLVPDGGATSDVPSQRASPSPSHSRVASTPPLTSASASESESDPESDEGIELQRLSRAWEADRSLGIYSMRQRLRRAHDRWKATMGSEDPNVSIDTSAPETLKADSDGVGQHNSEEKTSELAELVDNLHVESAVPSGLSTRSRLGDERNENASRTLSDTEEGDTVVEKPIVQKISPEPAPTLQESSFVPISLRLASPSLPIPNHDSDSDAVAKLDDVPPKSPSSPAPDGGGPQEEKPPASKSYWSSMFSIPPESRENRSTSQFSSRSGLAALERRLTGLQKPLGQPSTSSDETTLEGGTDEPYESSESILSEPSSSTTSTPPVHASFSSSSSGSSASASNSLEALPNTTPVPIRRRWPPPPPPPRQRQQAAAPPEEIQAGLRRLTRPLSLSRPNRYSALYKNAKSRLNESDSVGPTTPANPSVLAYISPDERAVLQPPLAPQRAQSMISPSAGGVRNLISRFENEEGPHPSWRRPAPPPPGPKPASLKAGEQPEAGAMAPSDSGTLFYQRLEENGPQQREQDEPQPAGVLTPASPARALINIEGEGTQPAVLNEHIESKQETSTDTELQSTAGPHLSENEENIEERDHQRQPRLSTSRLPDEDLPIFFVNRWSPARSPPPLPRRSWRAPVGANMTTDHSQKPWHRDGGGQSNEMANGSLPTTLEELPEIEESASPNQDESAPTRTPLASGVTVDPRATDQQEIPEQTPNPDHPQRQQSLGITDVELMLARADADPSTHYDELLMFGEIMGQVQERPSPTVLAERLVCANVEVLRRRVTKEGKVKQKLSVGGVACNKCSICLSQFKKDEAACIVPVCMHVFHEKCMGRWILSNNICPFCRRDLMS